MAVTVLGHMKASKGSNKAQHLQNSINYIMDPAKTENGLWTGSNCGNNEDEIYRAMIATKEEYGKTWGRQGYHFVISFPPEENVDEKTVYEFGKKFCQTYLKNNYEYCFAVHNDHDHLHCHIVFNSVDRFGNKYRYLDGDWEKRIQPVTDALCREFGLSELTYDKKNRIGRSYVEHMAEKHGKIVWSDIIRADIDAAASRSYSREGFFDEMRNMGYQIRQGNSSKHGVYIAYQPPGSQKARRDYNLGEGYRLTDIDEKILRHDMVQECPLYDSKFSKIKTDNSYQRYLVLRIRQATMYHIFRAEELDQGRVRKDLLRIEQLEEECEYLMAHPISGVDDLDQRLQDISVRLKALRNSSQSKAHMLEHFDQEEREIIREYQKLKARLHNPDISDEEFEDMLERVETMEDEHQEILAYANMQTAVVDEAQMEGLTTERRILRRIRNDVIECARIREAALRQEYIKQEEIVQEVK